ncbi:MAG: hypothetical protein ACE5PT_08735 [Gemmatimonadales bacterium]
MFKAILVTQLKWSRLAVAVTTVACFALPLLTVRSAGAVDPDAWDVALLLDSVRAWSGVYPFLAAAVGLVLATTAWANDHRSGHVHALSLPLPRWYFVLLRFGAGLVLLLVPVVALWIGSIIAAAVANIPAGLQAYPHAITVRFLLAGLVAYGFFFAISASTTRTAGYALAVIGALFAGQAVLAAGDSDVDIVSPVFEQLVTIPGPLEVFTGNWMLIDV